MISVFNIININEREMLIMKKIKIQTFNLLSASILLVVSCGVRAEQIYTDQIVLDSLGDDVCRAGYRPVDHLEASTHRNYFASKMGQWDIIGLKGKWVIMGPGYNSVIKEELSNQHQPVGTWCVPLSGQSDIPNYSMKTIPEGDEIDIQYALVNDYDNFVRPLSYLAHYLGYAWVGGNNSSYVGRDMDVTRSGDQWFIQGNNNGSCSGYRCGEKTKITINNFAYTVDDGNFSHGDVVESDRELVKTISVMARNYSDIPQQVVVDLTVDESTSWSKTNTYGFSQKVATENTFEWPLVGETKLTIEFGANQSFGNTNGGSTSHKVSLQARPMIPANSQLPIRLDLYRSDISYPYQFDAKISYDTNFNGFLRWGGNAWNTHPENRPYRSHTFSMGRSSEPSADIRYQWDHRYIPGEVKWWDWSYAITQNGLSNMQYATGKSLRPFKSYVSGDFYAKSQYAGAIEIGKPIELKNGPNSRGTVPEGQVMMKLSDSIVVFDNFDIDELESLGFGNAELSIRIAE